MATIAIELMDLIEGDNCSDPVKIGVKTLLTDLKKDHYLIVHTQLLSEDVEEDLDALKKLIEDWLHAHNLPWDIVWDRCGKPQADHYVETLDQLRTLHASLCKV